MPTDPGEGTGDPIDCVVGERYGRVPRGAVRGQGEVLVGLLRSLKLDPRGLAVVVEDEPAALVQHDFGADRVGGILEEPLDPGAAALFIARPSEDHVARKGDAGLVQQ